MLPAFMYSYKHCVSKRSHLSTLCNSVKSYRFSACLHCWKAYEICYKAIWLYPPHIRHVATQPWKIKKKSFFADIQQISKNAYKFRYWLCWKYESFSILIANKIFNVTVLLLIYFCDQFVAPEIRHSRRHCSVCQQSTWYTAMRTRFW